MKKLIIAVFAVGFCLPALAQTSVRFGLKAGGNLSFSKTSVGNVSVNADAKPGFFGGGLVELSPGYAQNKFKVQLEALYNQSNFQYSLPNNSSNKSKIKIHQLSLPLLAKYFVFPDLSVNLGPTFNFNLGGAETLSDTTGVVYSDKLTSEDLTAFQVGLAAGVTFYVCEGFFIDARYNPLFGQLNKSDESTPGTKIKLSYIQLGIGYKF